ncbi:MAG: hypothetical protein AAGI17_09230 [Planctomycetota bacterium]
MNVNLKTGVVGLSILGLTSPALAQLDEGDIGVQLDDNNQIVTSLIAEEEEGTDGGFGGGAFGPEQRVFIAEIGIVEFEPSDGTPGSGGADVFQDILPSVSSFSTNTPGFDSGPGVFAPGTNIGFDILGFDVFDPSIGSFASTASVPGAQLESLLIEFNTTLLQTTGTVPGIPFATAFPNGGLPVFSNGRSHRHFNFTLLPVNGAGTASLADPGVYALTLRLTSTDPSVISSEPIILLFAFGVAETDQLFTDAVNEALALTAEEDPVAASVDFDGNGVINISDLFAFITAFTSQQP